MPHPNLAMRIDAYGSIPLANAGHLAPYRNGRPVAMEGALPLGLFAGTEPSITHFQLRQKDRLLLFSDGILEAANARGELFGFVRTEAKLETNLSITELADAAQRFGQDDDIGIISILCIPTPQPAT